MKVAYVVYIERPASGLMRTQVVSLLKELKRRHPEINLHLVAFWQPWVAWRQRKGIRQLRAELAAAGVKQVDFRSAIFPGRFFFYNVRLFAVMHAWVRQMFRRALRSRYDVVHCRGYVPSYVAAELIGDYGHQVVFDMRSLWPKEHVTIGAWRAGDPIDRMWTGIEAFTLQKSGAAIGVSEAMVEEIRRIDPQANALLVPICVDLDRFRFDSAARERLRTELGWSSNPVVVYQGSLGLLNSNLKEVAEYFALIHQARPDVRFLVLTSNFGVDVGGILTGHGIARELQAVRHPKEGELGAWLSAADAGIHAMSPGPDSATRLGVKIVEYLSCSLPILVNEHVGAAAELVRRHGVGELLDTRDVGALRIRLDRVFSELRMPSTRSRSLASDLFSVQSCADTYASLYRQLAGSAIEPGGAGK